MDKAYKISLQHEKSNKICLQHGKSYKICLQQGKSPKISLQNKNPYKQSSVTSTNCHALWKNLPNTCELFHATNKILFKNN